MSSSSSFVDFLDGDGAPSVIRAGKVLQLRVVFAGEVVHNEGAIDFSLVDAETCETMPNAVVLTKQRGLYTFRVRVAAGKLVRDARICAAMEHHAPAFCFSPKFRLRSKSRAQLKRKRDVYKAAAQEKSDKRMQHESSAVFLATGMPCQSLPVCVAVAVATPVEG